MNYLEFFGTLVGLLYLYLEYKASIHLWIVGIIMPAIYLFVYYEAGLYADVGINIYYIIAAAYGWLSWKYGGKKQVGKVLQITRIPMRYCIPLTFVSAAVFLLIAGLLIQFTDSNVPWLDSFTTALSIVGMWMLARKYLEQWVVWIVVDVVSSGLFIYKELYFTAGLYTLYTIIAIFGYFKWKRLMYEQMTTV